MTQDQYDSNFAPPTTEPIQAGELPVPPVEETQPPHTPQHAGQEHPMQDPGSAPQHAGGAYAQMPQEGASGQAAPVNPVSPKAGRGGGSQKQGAGKTFLYGFLGALVACVLCLGGFAIYNTATGHSAVGATYIGTKDSSVINAVEEGQTLAEAVAAKALPSVVAIYNYQDQQAANTLGMGAAEGSSGTLSATGMGSGVVISDDGYIITNYHVVDGATELRVTVEGVERDAKYVGGDSSSDIAVVKVNDTTGLTPIDLGDSDDLSIGEWVMTIGAPLGLEQSVATGVVSATNRSTFMTDQDSSGMYASSNPNYTYYPNMIQTDAVINPGNSGGALVDADGKLIGINAMISSYSGDYAGVGFAIPINYAIGIATDVIQGKTPTHAMLGVSISTVNEQTAQRYGFDVSSGAYINSITPGTYAADSGLQPGDIITAIDGTAISSATDVTLTVRSHKEGDTVTVTVNRDGDTKEIPVQLSSDSLLDSQGSQDQGQQQEQQNQNQQNPYGNGQGQQYDQQDIERLLRMFGF